MFVRDWYLHFFQTSTTFSTSLPHLFHFYDYIKECDSLGQHVGEREKEDIYCCTAHHFLRTSSPERQTIFPCLNPNSPLMESPFFSKGGGFLSINQIVLYNVAHNECYSLDQLQDSRSCSSPITKAVILTRYDVRLQVSHSSA